MRQLAIKVTLCFAWAVLLISALVLSPIKSGNFLYSLINKRDLIRAHQHENKIVILGGSSQLVGFDARVISTAIGRPALVFALYDGFDLEFQAYLIAPFLHQGDLVILSPEYTELWTSLSMHPEAIPVCLLTAPEYALKNSYKLPSQAPLVLSDTLAIARDKVTCFFSALVNGWPRQWFGYGYIRYDENVDEFGGCQPTIFRKKSATLFKLYEKRYTDATLEANCSIVNAVGRELESTGARVAFVWPPFPESELRLNADLVKKTQALLSIRVLGEPEEFAYSYEFFTNTVNHLSAAGRQRRTESILRLIREDFSAIDARRGQSADIGSHTEF